MSNNVMISGLTKSMAPRPSKIVVTPLTRAIDHYFELALYLLVLTGFGTLAATGGLDLPATILAGAALAVRGFLIAKRRKLFISERWTTPLSIAYFLFFALDYLVFSRAFLPATIHLALFGVVIRMFSLRKERDYVTLAVLAFLMVLSSAVLTVDSAFLFPLPRSCSWQWRHSFSWKCAAPGKRRIFRHAIRAIPLSTATSRSLWPDLHLY